MWAVLCIPLSLENNSCNQERWLKTVKLHATVTVCILTIRDLPYVVTKVEGCTVIQSMLEEAVNHNLKTLHLEV